MKMNTNFLEIGAAEGWSGGELRGLRRTQKDWLCLEEGQEKGCYISEEIQTPDFENLVVCWNGSTPEGTWTELEARVYLTEKGIWSPWGSWGRWSPYIERRNNGGVYPQKDPLIRMNCDILEVLADSAGAVQIRAWLYRGKGTQSPVLRRVTLALRNRKLKEIPSGYKAAKALPESCILSTPACSQMVRDPEVGNCICNPTTMTVLLADRGEQVLPEVMAMSCVDLIEGFGNWTYAAAAVGMYGFRAYARFADYDILKQELAEGRSVGVSVHYANTPEKAKERELPYLEGAPCNTAGHILTVRGYGREGDQEYVYVSDSAAGQDEEAFLRYHKEQFLEAWEGRLCYIVDSEPEADTAAPAFEAACLRRTDSGRYMLFWRDQAFPVLKEMLEAKRREPGKMCLMLRQTREYPEPRMDANDVFQYPEPDEKGCFDVPEGIWTVYLISNTGLRLQAQKKDL